MPDNSNVAVGEITDHFQGLVGQAKADFPDIDFYFTGDVFISHVMTGAATNDMQVLTR
ncbi:MAG: hypothetical protein OXD42_09445 [Rhodospirillaceae bacterium]|nr:hypothetical protein [Rhodospirillaceae bacterium]MCY4238717.1 hypothetical protein [Rhodospirillaceae bacterium]